MTKEKIKILVVDDNDQMRGLLRLTFNRDLDYDIFEAHDGNSALKMVDEIKPDLVFLDVLMAGGIDGIDVCRFIKSNMKECFVIILTAKAEDNDIALGMATGADMYLIKPFSPLQLIEIVKEFNQNKNVQQDVPLLRSLTSPKSTVTESEIYNNLNGLDGQRLQALEIMLGSQEKVLDSIKSFAKDFSDAIPEIKKIIDSQKYEQACKELHTLKGCAANIGANTLATLANEVEMALKKEESFEKELLQLASEWDKVKQTIHKLSNSNTTKESSEFTVDLSDLAEKLQNNKIIPTELLEKLQQNSPDEYKTDIDGLNKKINSYQYDMALAVVDEILHAIS